MSLLDSVLVGVLHTCALFFNFKKLDLWFSKHMLYGIEVYV